MYNTVVDVDNSDLKLSGTVGPLLLNGPVIN